MSQNQELFRPNQLKRAHSGRRAEAADRELYREQEALKLAKIEAATPAERVAYMLRRVSDLLFSNAELRKQTEQLRAEALQWRTKAEALEQVIADSYTHEAEPIEVVKLVRRGPR